MNRARMDDNTVHGPPLQARVVAADRAVLANCATILAHMAMNKGGGGGCKTERGQTQNKGQQAWMAKVGRQGMAK